MLKAEGISEAMGSSSQYIGICNWHRVLKEVIVLIVVPNFGPLER